MTTDPRCPWCLATAQYQHYHDHEWGVPTFDDQKLFEFLILEGAQAGLSWRTVLEKRAGYARAFHNFDPARVAAMSDAELEALTQNSGIIRNKLKINSARHNARAFLKVQQEHGNFARYLWAYVDGNPITNHFKSLSEVPVRTELSDQISNDLKRRGFKFVGSTIIYAYLQAMGLVNDHLIHCPRHRACTEHRGC
ncbi:DNA-3-methyladenine glycosylase I [Sinimarinibacterium sp. NLF-5-8]|uniref:DNA-3-methyladenine glycosylase I n=1 Tax=Sinimarinibacterium sp. NLF-5-8 TaxID=2698684 RepID=UPI00137C0EDA|nr:DNA-3-methyladenine glycosylase I [Sinimarinibacterium sp. NLF-5-8]QHS09517.1 DNA-3-methyladenine glycosylase I [Sinimarinibacterium sp. NLF-5-8]